MDVDRQRWCFPCECVWAVQEGGRERGWSEVRVCAALHEGAGGRACILRSLQTHLLENLSETQTE